MYLIALGGEQEITLPKLIRESVYWSQEWQVLKF